MSAITRLRLDACWYAPAPVREAGKRGRHALKGKVQPKLSARLTDPRTQWKNHTLSCYGGTTREMEIATGTALWYQSPVPPVAIRWVLIRDPGGKYEPMALLCTDQDGEAARLVEWLVLRWMVAVTFHEVRDLMAGRDAAPMGGCGDAAHHCCLGGPVFGRSHFCASLVGWPRVSCSAGGLVEQSLADLFRYARLRAPASLALHLFFGVVQRKRHRSHSTSAFRSLRGYARFRCVMRINRLKHLDKVWLSGHINVEENQVLGIARERLQPAAWLISVGFGTPT